jgi:hypothetical protein
VEDETVKVTFSKGTQEKIKRRYFWTATDERLMWTDQARFSGIVFVTKEKLQ